MSTLRMAFAVAALLTVVALPAGCDGGPAASPPPSPSDSVSPQVPAASSERLLPTSFSVSTGKATKFSSGDNLGEVLVLYFSFPG